jgi:hypothetical protein
MATDTINLGKDADIINTDLDGITINWPNMAATGVNYQDIYTVSTGGIGNLNYDANAWITTSGLGDALSVKGDANFDGDVTVQGRNLREFMESVEQRLNILRPNTQLEAEWDQLRELGEQYRKLEQELEEKSRMWASLKK